MVLVGHEQDVARHGQHRCTEGGIAAELAAPRAAPGQDHNQPCKAGQRNQEAVTPQPPVKRPPQAEQRPVKLLRLVVLIDEEQVFVVGPKAEVHNQRHPQAERDRGRGGRCKCALQGAFAIVPERRQQRPCQRGQQKDRGGLGEEHQREQQPNGHGGGNGAAQTR